MFERNVFLSNKFCCFNWEAIEFLRAFIESIMKLFLDFSLKKPELVELSPPNTVVLGVYSSGASVARISVRIYPCDN